MNIKKIKYCFAVAIISVATAFCGCEDAGEELVAVDDVPVQALSGTADEPGEDAGQAPSDDGTRGPAGQIKVYVCGAVNSPDVYTLEAGMRVIDAVNAAGGFNKDAGRDYLNLAASLADGQKVYIPTVAEIEAALEEGIFTSKVNITSFSPGVERGSNGTDGVNTESSGTSNDGMVNINTASPAVLMTLPGIGQSKADKIIAYREANGGFSCIEDIMLVGGIKEGLFNKVKDKICVR